jgi:hypothetical protein
MEELFSIGSGQIKTKTYPLLQFRLVKLGTVVLFIQT